MRVVFSNGKEGNLSDEQSQGLYIAGRTTKAAWEELEQTMNDLDVTQFDDPLLSGLGTGMISINYVRNQVRAHQE